MINKRIMEILKPMIDDGIPVSFMTYFGSNDKYIIFNTVNQDDTNYSDDVAECENITVSITYWYKNDTNQLIRIKNLMKNAGFLKISESDVHDLEYYGRAFLFEEIRNY